MRLLHVMAGAEKGGAEKFFDRLVPALAHRGVHQQVICRSYAPRLKIMASCGVPVIHASFHRLLDFKTRRTLRQTIQQYRPDIVMTWMSRASHLCPTGNFTFVARLGGYYDLKYYQKASHLIGNTADLQAYFIKEGWPEDQTAYLPNFADPPTAILPQDRAVYATPEKAPLLLSLGRYHSDKAFDVLIKALSQLSGVYLWLLGEGESDKKLRYLAAEYNVQDRIRFIPWQQNVSAFYKAADLYVCPSRIEPLGNVVIEAWAHQKAVVAADSAGPKSLITHNHNGLLFAVDDVTALAQALGSLVHNAQRRQELAQKGFDQYRALFTEQKVCDQYLAFFQKLMSQRKH